MKAVRLSSHVGNVCQLCGGEVLSNPPSYSVCVYPVTAARGFILPHFSIFFVVLWDISPSPLTPRRHF